MSKGKETAAESTSTPKAAVGRVSLYLRQLESFHREGQETVSSTQLGSALAITDAQVRKDLAYFGQFGYPGIGYRVTELRDSLKAILGTNRTWKVALVGVGNLGRALLRYGGFPDRGFVISALFDNDPNVIGKQIAGMGVHPLSQLSEISQAERFELAALAVPASSAEAVLEAVLAAGIVGILNFAPVRLKVPEDVSVVSVDLGLQFEQLAFQVNQRRLSVHSGNESS